jgi:NitT/TauT family transport system permease protein
MSADFAQRDSSVSVNTGSGPASRLRSALLEASYPIATFAVVLIAWQFLARPLGIPAYILPIPSEFLAELVNSRALIAQHTVTTAWETVLGFILSTVISIPLGYFIVRILFLERTLYPLIVAFKIIPKVAIAPLFIVWFGFGTGPKIWFTFMMCFFPTLVAAIAGFRALEERTLYLVRSMGASSWQTFRYVRMPAALDYIFAGMKISIVFATTGAIVAEFVGGNSGLGYLMLHGTSTLDMSLIFAVLVVLCALGLLLAYVIEVVERIAMPWKTVEQK